MGRTLHYELKGSYIPTLEEENKLISLSKSYNQKFEWTCENVWLSTLDYYPNWSHFGNSESSDSIWKKINNEYDRIFKQGLSDGDTLIRLRKKGLIAFHHRDHLRGFTKVGGNELNAHTVILFVREASKILPNKVFSLRDEGDALYCPLLIKNGQAKPDIERMKDSLDYWQNRQDLHDGGSYDVSNTETYYKDLIRINPNWRDIDQYVRPLIGEAVLIKRKPFKTTILEKEDMADLQEIVTDFLRKEREESSQYYEDTKLYPVLSKPQKT